MIKAEWTNKDSLDLQPTCNQLATDSISRQAAIDAFTYKWDGMVTSVFDVLKELPSAQPEIIRCKDCRWYLEDEYGGWCTEVHESPAEENGYCNYAERKTDGSD